MIREGREAVVPNGIFRHYIAGKRIESSDQESAEVVNIRDMLFCIIARDSSDLYSCSMADLQRLL